MFLARRKYSDH